MDRKVIAHADVLLVGQTPPPYHGQAVVTAMLFENNWRDLKVARLRMSYSDSIDHVGKFGIGKVIHLFALVIKTWWLALTKQPRVLYYLPASANKVPVIRDIIYLGAVRWLFKKTVFHYHAGGLPEYIGEAGLFGKLATRAYSNADVSVEICRTDHSPGREFQANNTVVIPNGVDVGKCQRTRQEEEKIRILFLGALSEGKGAIDIIQSAKVLRERGCHLTFQMVGAWASDDFKNRALGLIDEAGLTDIFEFSGVLKGDAKWQAYADADVFFFPSHYQSENFPLVLIEALAYGLPVVSTNWRGIPQLVGDSNAAILCEINAPEQYADALEEVAKHPDRREQMGRAAQQHYETCYTREKFLARMEEVFRSLLAQ
jgi:glycosyltransferase involved in cell wall biosynthesis